MTGVWVASTTWAVHSRIITLPGIETVGTVLGFTDMTQPVSLITPYTHELFTKIETERLKKQITAPQANVSPLDNPCPGCWNLSPANVSIVDTELIRRTAFSVYSAVYGVAQALHNMLGCSVSKCSKHPKNTKIYPWQVCFQVIKQIIKAIFIYHMRRSDDYNEDCLFILYTVVTMDTKCFSEPKRIPNKVR